MNTTREPIHVIIMGVSGSGKTTVAGILSDRLGWAVAEADDFHPQANISKMASGVPLTDDDRWPWLESLRTWMQDKESCGESTIVTCSALKKSYRDVLRQGGTRVVFMHLDGDRDLLARRLAARTDHFMPVGLLDSQFATLEPLAADELGHICDIAATPQNIASEIEAFLAQDWQEYGGLTKIRDHMLSVEKRGSSSHPARADIGVYGLGVMGAALARNLARKGYTVAVTNIDSSVTQQFLADFGDEGDFIEATTVEDFAAELKTPRVAMLMVTAGQAVDSVSASLAAYFSPGDVIVDMGNSHFGDTCRRQEHFAHAGLHFVGCGTSGGQQGALLGPALMVGGSAHAYARLGAMFESIAAKADDGAPCCAHVGEKGAGHFVKTLHNGIEYADMQLISEAYALLRSGLGMSAPSIGEIFAEWNQGELNSYLTEITADILIREDSPGVPLVDVIDDAAGQKGTGLWAAQIALELGVPASILIEAVQTRVLSAAPYRSRNAQRNIVGGDTDSQRWSENSSGTVGDFEEMIEHVRRALYLGKIASYSQGFSIIDAGSLEYGWNINKAQVALNWRAGCIIRAELLEKISDAFSQEPELDLLLASPLFNGVIDEYLSSLRIVTELAVSAGVPAPALYATLSYLDSLRSDRLPTALIQAQRDCFGSHGFKRVDKDGVFHEEW